MATSDFGRDRLSRRDAGRGDRARSERDRMVAERRGPSRGVREMIATASGLNLIAGIWLIIAPWVLNYVTGDPYWNDVVFGAIVGILALIRMTGAYETAAASVVNLLVGAWLFASAFWLDQSNIAAWNDIILGIVVFVLAALSLSATPAGTRMPATPRRTRRAP